MIPTSPGALVGRPVSRGRPTVLEPFENRAILAAEQDGAPPMSRFTPAGLFWISYLATIALCVVWGLW